MTKARKPTLAPGLLAKPGAAAKTSTPVEALPPSPTPPGAPAVPIAAGASMKTATKGTTLYLLPSESKRLHRLALDLDMSLHDLVLDGIDRVLAEQGQPPLERYKPAKPKKGG